MKSTKNSTNTKSAKSSKGCCNSSTKNTISISSKKSGGGTKNSKNSSQEDEGDPFGSYTGNPLGWGKYADPVQDVDDL